MTADEKKENPLKPYVIEESVENIKLTQKFSFFRYAKNSKGGIITFLFMMLIMNMVGLARVAAMAKFVEQVTLTNYDGALIWFMVFVAANLFNDIADFFVWWIHGGFMTKMVGAARKEVFSLVLTKGSRSFMENSTGRFLSRMGNEQHTAIQGLSSVMEVGIYALYDLMIIIYMATLNIWIGVVTVLSAAVIAFTRYQMAKVRRRREYALKKASDIVSSVNTETVKGERDIKTLNIEEPVKELVFKKVDTYLHRFLRRRRWQPVSSIVSNVIIDLCMFAIMFLALFLTKDYGLSVGVLMFVVLNINVLWSLSNSLNQIGQNYTDYKTSVERINELYDELIFPTESFGEEDIEINTPSIEFKNVNFSYKSLSERVNDELYDDDGRKIKREKTITRKVNVAPVLHDCSFKIEPYKTIGIVGKSGGGKTTILNLIAKLYDADEGEVLLDGIDVKRMTKDSLRKNITLVNQSTYIFDTTIRQNLSMVKPEATEEEMLKALENASFLDFAKGLPKGLDTKVGEGGVMLSGGQKQRLSIARAFLRASKYILFDESTSSLDNISQNDIKESINELKGKHTIVVVAHRLSTVKTCDLIYFVSDGQVKAKGTFDELLNGNLEFKEFFMADTF